MLFHCMHCGIIVDLNISIDNQLLLLVVVDYHCLCLRACLGILHCYNDIALCTVVLLLHCVLLLYCTDVALCTDIALCTVVLLYWCTWYLIKFLAVAH